MPDLIIVLLSWVFVVTRVLHAGVFAEVFVTANDTNSRSLAYITRARWCLLAMWAVFCAAHFLADLNGVAASASSRRKISMVPAARLSAAIELIEAIDKRARPRGEGAEGLGHGAPLCRLRARSRRDFRV